jgi:carbon monoxide dehydrogenase subunit G
VDLEASVELDAPPERIYAEVADLGTYPEWLGIVLEAERDGDGAWFVELGARIGPVKAGKRVRMARVVDEAPTHVRFERDERDGEAHSSWVLDASLAGSTLTMRLHYGGDLFVPMLDKILQAEIDKAGPRLQERLAP